MARSRNMADMPGCAMEASVGIIGGKWKGVILFHLLKGPTRFNELTRQMRGITPRLLTKQLRELEEDGLVLRTVYPVVPPKVEYSLTEEALTLAPLLRQLSDWGNGWLNRRGITLRQDCDVFSAAATRDDPSDLDGPAEAGTNVDDSQTTRPMSSALDPARPAL